MFNHLVLSAFRYAFTYASQYARPLGAILVRNAGAVSPAVALTIRGEIGGNSDWQPVAVALSHAHGVTEFTVSQAEWELLVLLALQYDVRFAPDSAHWWSQLFAGLDKPLSAGTQQQLIDEMTWHGPTHAWQEPADVLQAQ